MVVITKNPTSLGGFLRAKPELLRDWMLHRQPNLVTFCVAAIVIGAGVYGAVMGSWRSPLQALYTGVKLPLVILLTTLGNGLLNGMLAPLLGLNLTFRQSLTAVLMSFAFMSMLGALSPVAWFVVWNTPPLTAAMQSSSPEYGVIQLMLAVFIAFAGFVGNAHLLPLLTEWAHNRRVAGGKSFSRQPDLLGAATVHLGSGAAGGVYWARIFSRQFF